MKKLIEDDHYIINSLDIENSSSLQIDYTNNLHNIQSRKAFHNNEAVHSVLEQI